MSTTLKIWTAWNKTPRERMIWEEEPPVIIHPPTVQIRVYFELRDHHGRKGITMIWKMEATENYDEPTMRRHMLASTRWERDFYGGEPDRNNITAIEVDDPTGLLKWLCPGQDLKDFFNAQNTKQLNDKPLRLPAAN